MLILLFTKDTTIATLLRVIALREEMFVVAKGELDFQLIFSIINFIFHS